MIFTCVGERKLILNFLNSLYMFGFEKFLGGRTFYFEANGCAKKRQNIDSNLRSGESDKEREGERKQ